MQRSLYRHLAKGLRTVGGMPFGSFYLTELCLLLSVPQTFPQNWHGTAEGSSGGGEKEGRGVASSSDRLLIDENLKGLRSVLKDRFRAPLNNPGGISTRLAEAFWLVKKLKSYDSGECLRKDPTHRPENVFLADLKMEKMPCVAEYAERVDCSKLPSVLEPDEVSAHTPPKSPVTFTVQASTVDSSRPGQQSRVFVMITRQVSKPFDDIISIHGYTLFALNTASQELVQAFHPVELTEAGASQGVRPLNLEKVTQPSGILEQDEEDDDDVEAEEEAQTKCTPCGTLERSTCNTGAEKGAASDSASNLEQNDSDDIVIEYQDYIVLPVAAPVVLKGFVEYSTKPRASDCGSERGEESFHIAVIPPCLVQPGRGSQAS